ncbi:ferritin-like domain-containing protein [Candidatus Methylocalor cossyra]|uniref:Ferritin-like domain-containing protein n=1 Tax=Candidatus Methylocalor cossyra TaxID=3108543 RepID=A0ABM9NHD6_9GAMM
MASETELYALAEACLWSPEVEDKLAATDRAAAALRAGRLTRGGGTGPRPASEVRFPAQLRWVDPRALPRRKLGSPVGRAAFLHALAHIEFTAIHLAFDMAYRFRDLPEDFSYDWLQVAIEEAAHFRALRRRLRDFGCDYGELPVHRGLWELAERTACDPLPRLALVPRGMEAHGLDVTPGLIAKLKALGDGETALILERILEDEIGHVRLGSLWFRRLCQQRGRDPESEYFALLERHGGAPGSAPLNHAARRAAGFSDTELARLKATRATAP